MAIMHHTTISAITTIVNSIVLTFHEELFGSGVKWSMLDVDNEELVRLRPSFTIPSPGYERYPASWTVRPAPASIVSVN